MPTSGVSAPQTLCISFQSCDADLGGQPSTSSSALLVLALTACIRLLGEYVSGSPEDSEERASMKASLSLGFASRLFGIRVLLFRPLSEQT